jgi:hypothetical protein
VESRRTLVAEKVWLTNRLTAALKNSYPQVLEWFEDKDTQVFCDFLTQYPDLKAVQAAPAEELEQFFKTHHVVQAKTIHRHLEQILQGGVFTEDPGVVEKQWAKILGALATELSAVSQTDVCGMGAANPKTLILGRGVLPNATQKKENASSRNSRFGL